jgi:dUTP pyrophosphatase
VVPEIQIRPRSGLAAKKGITILNSPATVDCDYSGEIKVNLINHSNVPFTVNKGDRIAQGVCAFVLQLPDITVKEVERGDGGHGSTGV